MSAKSTQFFFRSKRPELDIMDAFAQITGIVVDSLDYPKPDACGAAMFTRYAEGFELGTLISWPFGIPLPKPEPELVERLARTLNTTVLLESVARPETWLTASKACACRETGVEYLDDGIELS